MKTWKYVFQTFQFRLNLIGTKPQFAEIFRYYITKAEIIQNRGFRSTLKQFTCLCVTCLCVLSFHDLFVFRLVQKSPPGFFQTGSDAFSAESSAWLRQTLGGPISPLSVINSDLSPPHWNSHRNSFFLSFFFWFGRPKPISGRSGWWAPD